jgi:hypothetical protein
MLQVMTTEHSVLQAGRSATIFETGGRTAVFLGTVSSALVALALIGQVSRLGKAFFAFLLVLLPTLFFLGLVTFERTLELGIEDYIYAVGISRIRHFYVEMVPQAEKYFVGSIHDDFASTMAPTLFGRRGGLSVWQSFLTVPGAIGTVNGVIAGSFAGVLVQTVVVESLPLSAGVGTAVFIASVILQRRHQVARWQEIEDRLPTLFPSERTP